MFYAKIDYYLLKKCGVNDINSDRTGTLRVACVVEATFLKNSFIIPFGSRKHV